MSRSQPLKSSCCKAVVVQVQMVAVAYTMTVGGRRGTKQRVADYGGQFEVGFGDYDPEHVEFACSECQQTILETDDLQELVRVVDGGKGSKNED